MARRLRVTLPPRMVDRPAGGAGGGIGGVDGAADDRQQLAGPALDGDFFGLDGAAGVGGEGVHVSDAEEDFSFGCADGTGMIEGVGGRGGGGRDVAGDVNAEAAGGGGDEYVIAGGHDDGALVGRDDGAVIGDGLAHERDEVALDGAQIANLAGSGEVEIARKEVGIGEIGGRGKESAGVDYGSGAEHDAIGVDEVDVSVGEEGAVDLRGRGGGDAIEHARGGGGLDELDGFAAGDVEAGVLDDGIVAGSNEGQGAVLGDVDGAGDDVDAGGGGPGGGGDGGGEEGGEGGGWETAGVASAELMKAHRVSFHAIIQMRRRVEVNDSCEFG